MILRATTLLLLFAAQFAVAAEPSAPKVRVEFPTRTLDFDPDTLKTMPAEDHYGQDVVLTPEIKARGPWALAQSVAEGHKTIIRFVWIAALYRYDAATGHYRHIAWCRSRKWLPNILDQAQDGDLVMFVGGE